MINLIVAQSLNGVIGINNSIPWKIPEELLFFRKMTLNKKIIMGFNTYQSLLNPLQNRENYVFLHPFRPEVKLREGFIPITNLLGFFKGNSNSDIFVIGGAELYKTSMYYVDKIYMSYILGCYEGDTYFPEYNKALWTGNIILEHEKFITVEYLRK